MDIKFKGVPVGEIDEVVNWLPSETIILRCMACQAFLLPKEVNILKIPIKDQFGRKTWWCVELCPVCFPDPQNFIDNNDVESSMFRALTREQFFTTRQCERAGLVVPDFKGATNIVTYS